jgi:nitric oxide reductase large subunit
MDMEYKSQRVAYPYFGIALLLFVLQVLMGLWLSVNYFATLPQGLVNVFSFATARAMHTNLLVLWLLLGFMGGTYFILPDETKSDIYSTKLAYIQLVILALTGVIALVGFLFGWNQGRPLLEIPTPLDFVIVIGVLMFLFNVAMTMLKAKRWTAVQGSLLGGLTFLAVMYLFGIPFYRNLAIDWYYWWWVIHLWVEGAWELVAAAIFAYVLIKITGVEREVVEKWLYVEIGLFLFTGIAGTGHHYYWLGAPRYWLWIGGIFSALEPLPILLMVIDTMRHVRHRKLEIANRLVWTYAVGRSGWSLFSSARGWTLGVCTHPSPNQLLHPRKSGHGVPWSSGFFRSLRDVEPHGVLLRHAQTERAEKLRGRPGKIRFLDHGFRHVLPRAGFWSGGRLAGLPGKSPRLRLYGHSGADEILVRGRLFLRYWIPGGRPGYRL